MTVDRRTKSLSVLAFVVIALNYIVVASAPRTINITADDDNRFKVQGQKQPVIIAKPGEVLKLKITARKSTDWEKDGSVHSFTINSLKDRGWDLRLKEGTQEFTVVAPDEPGEYVVECTVRCGKGHDDMKMKLMVAQ